MRTTILRILLSALLLSLISGALVSIFGFMRGWNSATQFSDGFFWAGILMIAVGFISFQGYGHRFVGWLPDHMESDDRTHVWAADIIRGKNLLAFFGISGLLLFGLSLLAILIGESF